MLSHLTFLVFFCLSSSCPFQWCMAAFLPHRDTEKRTIQWASPGGRDTFKLSFRYPDELQNSTSFFMISCFVTREWENICPHSNRITVFCWFFFVFLFLILLYCFFHRRPKSPTILVHTSWSPFQAIFRHQASEWEMIFVAHSKFL